MKVLIYTFAFAPRIGGVESSVRTLAEQLARAEGERLDVTVATETPAGDFDDATLPFRVVRRPGVARLWTLISQASVVHLAGPAFLPLVMGWWQRKPVVIRHHGYQACCPNGLLLYEPSKTACPGHFMARRYHRCLVCNAASAGWAASARGLLATFPRRWLSARAAMNVHIAHAVKDRLGLPRSCVVYYGIADPDAGATGGRPPAPDSATGPGAASRADPVADLVCFAYVGRFVSEKGLPLLVEAAARLRDRGERFRVKFIGDGPERPRLKAMVDGRGLDRHVAFSGFLEGQPLSEELADVTAVVMPSVWEETAGLSALEQMMRGRLVIASDIGGLGELVGHAGLKFPPGDVEGLIGCMLRVLKDPDLSARLGRAARARVRALCGQEVTLRRHVAILRSAVARQGEDAASRRSP